MGKGLGSEVLEASKRRGANNPPQNDVSMDFLRLDEIADNKKVSSSSIMNETSTLPL